MEIRVGVSIITVIVRIKIKLGFLALIVSQSFITLPFDACVEKGTER